MKFILGYLNCTSMLTIYGVISCRLKVLLSRIGNKHGFLKIEKFKLYRSRGCSYYNMYHIYQIKYVSCASGYCLQGSIDYFVISKYLKSCDYL